MVRDPEWLSFFSLLIFHVIRQVLNQAGTGTYEAFKPQNTHTHNTNSINVTTRTYINLQINLGIIREKYFRNI